VNEKDTHYYEVLTEKAKMLGFESLDLYLAARLALSLCEIAEELGESYYVFQRFHSRYIKEKEQSCQKS
jgi:hypothetical protein